MSEPSGTPPSFCGTVYCPLPRCHPGLVPGPRRDSPGGRTSRSRVLRRCHATVAAAATPKPSPVAMPTPTASRCVDGQDHHPDGGVVGVNWIETGRPDGPVTFTEPAEGLALYPAGGSTVYPHFPTGRRIASMVPDDWFCAVNDPRYRTEMDQGRSAGRPRAWNDCSKPGSKTAFSVRGP